MKLLLNIFSPFTVHIAYILFRHFFLMNWQRIVNTIGSPLSPKGSRHPVHGCFLLVLLFSFRSIQKDWKYYISGDTFYMTIFCIVKQLWGQIQLQTADYIFGRWNLCVVICDKQDHWHFNGYQRESLIMAWLSSKPCRGVITFWKSCSWKNHLRRLRKGTCYVIRCVLTLGGTTATVFAGFAFSVETVCRRTLYILQKDC